MIAKQYDTSKSIRKNTGAEYKSYKKTNCIVLRITFG